MGRAGMTIAPDTRGIGPPMMVPSFNKGRGRKESPPIPPFATQARCASQLEPLVACPITRYD
jgi:hypothetical protein